MATAVGTGFFDGDVEALEFDNAVADISNADSVALGVYYCGSR